MKKKIVISIVFFISGITAFAQYSETISSGRPGQAIGPFAVGKYVFQMQTGIDYISASQGVTTTGSYIPNSVFRYGILEGFELNSGLAYTFSEGYEDLSYFLIGSRINLYKGTTKLPAIGLQASFYIPTATDVSKKVLPEALFVVGGSFSNKLGYTINIGSSFNENFNATGKYVLNFSYSLSDKVGVFFEPYGTFTSNYFNIMFDTGLSYLVNNNFQLDILTGYGKNNNMSEFMVGAGFSWRFLVANRQ